MTITPLEKTKHFLVSAFMDQRIHGFDIRIIGIFKRDSIVPLSCVFCCRGQIPAKTSATILGHSDNYGFPYITTDVMCPMPEDCAARHVILVDEQNNMHDVNHTWLPIRNIETKENKGKMMKYNFTVCISTMFDNYNNVLQFTQTLEIYRLLGVDRVVIYNNSCGSELDRLLQVYIEDDFVEMVPWPINKHLVPSHGWLHSESGGDVHYFGQQTTLNECIYRSMERSRYVLLNDIDEIIMPYQHEDLMSLMDMLTKQHPKVGVFMIENHIFPKNHFEPSRKFHLPQWNDVPGLNVLEHIYRETPDRSIYHPHKMLLKPKMVEQTSIHEVLKNFGERYKVPLEVCRIIHVRTALRGTLEVLNVDKRLWDFSEKLIPNVDKRLKRAGLLA
ncbi:glycosyltransferase family 92 protein F13G3.3-like [Nelusetta ayraudi]|uniref:glycosyltransferase family 92 protein F13G3.3-like n=1 Tax=Nelusetta ayraudi TaxID=303726 RepID=UPI003F6ECAF3